MTAFKASSLRQEADSINKKNEEAKAATRREHEIQVERIMNELGPARVSEVYNKIIETCKSAAARGEYRASYSFCVGRSGITSHGSGEGDYRDTPLLTENGQRLFNHSDADPFTVYGKQLVSRLESAGFKVEFRSGRQLVLRCTVSTMPSIELTW